jgi:uncharacterized protein YbjT (DUF2867 family)
VILVTGATGNVGSQVVREVVARQGAVRAFVRDRAKAAALLPGVEVATGDFSDLDSLRRAMEGVEAVFLASADGPDKVRHETQVIDTAVECGVRKIVKCSTVRSEAGSPLPPFDWHGQIERHLKGSGVRFTILQSNFYMTNVLAATEQIRHEGRLFAPAGDGKIAMIDPRDVGSAAHAILMDEGPEGKTYVLTGPHAITYSRVAEELSAAIGRRVEFVDVPDEAARQGLVAAGMPDWLVHHLVAVFGLIRQGALEQTTDTVQALTGREPRSFAQFARDHLVDIDGPSVTANTSPEGGNDVRATA